MKRLLALLVCIPLLLTGCFGGASDSREESGLSDLISVIQGDRRPEEVPPETVAGIPEHIQKWDDPLQDIPEPTYYSIDEELSQALALIGIVPIPPEDTLNDEEPVIPMDGLWNTERTNRYQGTLNAESLQDYLAMYAKDQDLTALPPVMELAPIPIGGTENDPGSIQLNFYDGYNLQYSLNGKLEHIINNAIDAHNAPLSWGDDSYINLWFFGMINWELSMVASLTEDGSFDNVASGVAMALSFFGAENVDVVRNAAHDYTVTYNGTTEDRCFCDSATGSIQLVKHVDGQVEEIFEFLALEDGRRIWQTSRVRIAARFEEDTTVSFAYTVLNDGQPDYSVDDLVFPDGSACDEAWTAARGDFSQQFIYDGETLTVSWGSHTVAVPIHP